MQGCLPLCGVGWWAWAVARIRAAVCHTPPLNAKKATVE